LTGWAQIHGGRDLTASDKAALDLWYIKNASLRVDLRILLATLRMILFGERADPVAINQAWRELRWIEPSWRQDVAIERHNEWVRGVSYAPQLRSSETSGPR
jgi:hypothetical protein